MIMGIKLSDYINDENKKLTPEEVRQFLIDYGFDEEIYRKAKAWDSLKEYALSKNKDFEDRKDTARSNKEFNYFNTLQIANRAIINKCKQLEDNQND
ncbi:hypothetical protein AST00_10715 [Staphylococcus equorum]|uniref:hypothetical protein n=1 Tax=Staphylococcus equorum TaxID=246432 RepID=UPI00085326B6|nr:hypothetical protein [Staphylococcus equorum]OEK64375.1 hypothetical protein AST00_10715 [Staphylococcus equorum]